MADFSSQSLVEASDLLMLIAPHARSKAERRRAVWRKLKNDFSFHRIAEIDRRSERVVLSALELEKLRDAAGQGKADDFQRSEARISKLEAELAELRAFRERVESSLASMAAAGQLGEG